MLAPVGNEGIDGPCSAGETRLGELGPDGASSVGGGRSNVDCDRPLVAGSNDIVGTVVVVPFEGNLVTRGNWDAGRALSVGNVTDDIGARYILRELLDI